MLRLTTAEAEAYGVEIENAKSWARPFAARILQAGLVSYKDKGAGVSLLRHETIAKYAKTFVGRPVVCTPVDNSGKRFKHQRTTPENMKQIGHGYVTEVYFNDKDGWWWVKGVADTEESQKAIQAVGRCSCSYAGITEARPGEYHAIPYDNEITEFDGRHLAIVHNPRYEEANIFLNSKESNAKQPMNLLKLFWKKPAAAAADATKTGAEAAAQKLIDNGLAALSSDTQITLLNNEGAEEVVTVGQLAEVYNSRNVIDPKAEIEIDGTRVALSQLIDDRKALLAERENAKTREEEAQKEAKAKLAADNAKRPDHFRLVTSAANRPARTEAVKISTGTLDEGVAEGHRLFGSAAKA